MHRYTIHAVSFGRKKPRDVETKGVQERGGGGAPWLNAVQGSGWTCAETRYSAGEIAAKAAILVCTHAPACVEARYFAIFLAFMTDPRSIRLKYGARWPLRPVLV